MAGTEAKPSPETRARVARAYGKLPLSFEANQGQTDVRVKFLARGAGYTLFLTGNGALLALKKPGAGSQESGERSETREPNLESQQGPKSGARTPNPESRTPAVLRMKLAGANLNAPATGTDELPGRTNYFIGNDPAKWRTQVPSYAKVKYREVYPGVDLVYYGNQGELEYDFVVAPGANPSRIVLDVGAAPLHLAANGELAVGVGGGEVRFHKPVVYQPFATPGSALQSQRLPVEGSYKLTGQHQVSFEVGSYDRRRPLVIDPVLTYSTYLGGNDLDKCSGIALTPSGNATVSGSTVSTNFPVTSGAFQTTYGGGAYDAFVTQFSVDGSSLVFSTYLGGNNDDEGWHVALDSSENVYLGGYTASLNFPTTSNAYHTAFFGTGYDCFVAKLNPTGSALLYSTYIAPVDPGQTSEHNGDFLTVSSSGRAVIVGPTNYTQFPVTPGAFQTTLAGLDDAFVTVIDTTKSGSASLLYSTYLGGNANDVAQNVAVDNMGNIYVSGTTHSSNFPATAGAFQPACKLNSANACSGDAFLAKISPHGRGAADLLYSTFFGGSNVDEGVAIALDASGHVYMTGDTQSTDLPTTPGAFQTTCDVGTGGCEDSYIAKFHPVGGGASDLVYSTYFGGTGITLSKGIGIDPAANAYVVGRTTSTNFPTANPIQAAHASDKGNYDAFLTELNPSGSALVFSTYWGGNNFDTFIDLVLNTSGDIFLTGRTQSTSFPATADAFQTAHTADGGHYNAILTEISPLAGVGLGLGPASLSFSDQVVGTKSPAQTITVTAAGSGPLTITNMAASSGFGLTSNCGSSVAAGATCMLSVTFTPASSGTIDGTLTLTDNAPDSPQTLNLTGVGTFVQLVPTTLSFGSQPVGVTSPGKSITLTNKGIATLSITGISLTAPDPGDYAEQNTCGSSVGPGKSCSITVTFTPLQTGTRTANVSVADSDSGSPQTVALTGAGT
ncbi:MAG TPA: choice-of-anchor D domain-containing protein [Terriglobia bacterium]